LEVETIKPPKQGTKYHTRMVCKMQQKNSTLSLLFFIPVTFMTNKLPKKPYLQEWSCKDNVYRITESHRIHHSHLISLSKTKLFHHLTLRDASLSNKLKWTKYRPKCQNCQGSVTKLKIWNTIESKTANKIFPILN
jgi:hypothetical protein